LIGFPTNSLGPLTLGELRASARVARAFARSILVEAECDGELGAKRFEGFATAP
jgi:hypothetical protein